MTIEADTKQADRSKVKPGRSWVRVVICLQCLAVLILSVALTVVSGVVGGDGSADNIKAESTTPGRSEVADDDPDTASAEVSSPITESSLAETDEAESDEGTAVTPADSSSEKPRVHEEAAVSGKVGPKATKKAEEKKFPAEKKSPDPGVQNPLRQLPKTVEILGTLASRDEMVWGPLTMPPDVRLDIEMHGGATAHRVKIRKESDEPSVADRRSGFGETVKKSDNRIEYDGIPTFVLKETFDDAGNTFWIVDLTDYRGTIAKIWLANGQLRFQWTENSGVYEVSGYLANCVLLITVPEWGRVHTLALRKPVRAKPAAIDFVRGTATTEYDVKFMPPDVTLTVEVVGATKGLPKPTVGMDRWLTTDRDFTHLKFGDGAPLEVKVLASTQYADQRPRIVTAAFFSLPRVAENVAGTLSQLASIRTRTERTVQLLTGKKTELSKVQTQDAQQRAALAKTSREIDRDIRAYQSQLQRIQWLDGVTKSSQNPAGVVFRIIHSAGDHTIDLVHAGL